MSDYRTFQIELRVGRERIRISAEVPERPISLVELLPIVRSFSEMTTQVAAREVEHQGHAIQCGPRCGACCRQLVPVSPPEAADLKRVVSGLEPAHRERVLARFAETRERLANAGMLERLKAPSPVAEDGARQARRTLGLDYFGLGIPCPFLEEESCSIHPERPLACREYLVTSDPCHCERPDAESVVVVELPRRVSALFSRLAAESGSSAPAWIPLVLALDVPDGTGCEIKRSGVDLFEAWLRLISGGDLAVPAVSPKGDF